MVSAMTELIDNLTQLLVALLGFVLSGAGYLKCCRRPLFLLSCFYGCFALGTLYWLLYTQLIMDSPPIFYVSDISWISSFLFLLLLEFDVAGEDWHVYKCRASWLALAVEIPLTVYFISIGDMVYNIIIGALMTIMYWQGIRSAVWARRRERRKFAFYLVLLCFLTLENCLWISSYPWMGDTLVNPYFWFDFAVTASMFALYPVVRRAVTI